MLKINKLYNKLDPDVSFNTVTFHEDQFQNINLKDNYFDFSYSFIELDENDRLVTDRDFSTYFTVNAAMAVYDLERIDGFNQAIYTPVPVTDCKNSFLYNSMGAS